MDLGNIAETIRDKRRRKYRIAAVILVVLYLLDIFFISDILGQLFGIAGVVMHEILLAAMGVLVFVAMHGKLNKIYPFRKIRGSRAAGTIILWIGTYQITVFITMLIAFFFPRQMFGASEGVGELISGMPVWLGILVVALTPAICEELAFRGALLSCFRGEKSKWPGIILVALFFGFCHGSIWRMIPTAILGVAMGYILLETDNMIYNMLFHFINNLVPTLLLGLTSSISQWAGEEEMMDVAAQNVGVPIQSLGFYLMCAGGAPLLIYLGNYLLHRGLPGYDRGAFAAEKKRQFVIFVAIGVCCMAGGFFLMCVSTMMQMADGVRGFY